MRIAVPVKGFASATPVAEDPDGVAGAENQEKWRESEITLAKYGERHSFRAPLPQVVTPNRGEELSKVPALRMAR